MTESGFSYFLEYLQERNSPPKPKPGPSEPKCITITPKRAPKFDYAALAIAPPPQPDEDYTGSICLLHSLTELFPVYLEILVDAEDLERLSAHHWRLVRSGSTRALRVATGRGKFLHTVVMNAPPGIPVDHIFHRTLDNRKGKLRIVTVRENNLNTRPKKGGSSQYKGVQRSKKTGKWFVHAGPKGGKVFIGGFDSEVEAARAYNGLAMSLYGSAAYMNPV